ncbi:MAG: RND transporter [Hydrogenophaga sp.]|uniref:copper-binding protein n=1 Tax=Hydrogenophaga sp. TaxID=1904254 RepID=UPI00169C09A8|nr:copper-binding protein [Hydrogenophaga sp.]NIM42261.1 RND transporter [Hydrogenophaga sp.]NIN27993.1 RND transporter [Hydrogenophaga sp.]NIN32771.1 RND transporter [Hydrogenophaga sp.]NIN54660.1 RND transporter [Hydrogenophaga sp.]NIO51336.1 RND transporter [Hydrogenophaga sp.]
MNRLHLVAVLAFATASALAAEPTPADGEVRRINPAGQEITLKHGEIKNLDMPPMTMVFKVKEPALLANIKAGDKVRFTADQINGTYTVLSIEAVKP